MIIKRKATQIPTGATSANNKLPQTGNLGYGKYRLPLEADVPPDQYYSEIVHIENTTTRSDKEAIAVYYKITKFSDVFKKANNLLKKGEKLKIYYIKQIYPIDSEAYLDFIESMYEALELPYDVQIDMDQCVGVTEDISLGYTSRSGIGGINARRYWEDDDFIALYQYQYGDSSYPSVEYDEYGNEI